MQITDYMAKGDIRIRMREVWSSALYMYNCSISDTVDPLYTDTRYNDQIRYNGNLNIT